MPDLNEPVRPPSYRQRAHTLPVPMPPLCKNCRHAKPDRFPLFPFIPIWRFAHCTHPTAEKGLNPEDVREQLVTGKAPASRDRYYFCTTQRGAECGIAGKFWEPRGG